MQSVIKSIQNVGFLCATNLPTTCDMIIQEFSLNVLPCLLSDNAKCVFSATVPTFARGICSVGSNTICVGKLVILHHELNSISLAVYDVACW